MRKSRKKYYRVRNYKKNLCESKVSERIAMHGAKHLYRLGCPKPIGRGIVLNKNKKPRILTLAKVAYQNSSEDTNYRVVMWQAMQIMLRSAVV
ncbi:hypothetical protein [Limosilactobacillus equigenerosi]|uniref:hypothetical protein n=1 Tax=Limosilactobacillus equigenerosi TaxID=417373 RepID=UPI000704FF61|nr:hypothetical protein [Limosilactobacillus equigenerosi]